MSNIRLPLKMTANNSIKLNYPEFDKTLSPVIGQSKK